MDNPQVMLSKYIEAYRQYCGPVESLDDLKLAPFHILASEDKVYSAKAHTWPMDTLAQLCALNSGLLLKTPYKLVDVTNPDSEAKGTQWWTELTARGGEGMAVKPLVP